MFEHRIEELNEKNAEAIMERADEDYTALENDLRRQVDNIEFTHPEYDEYRYSLDEIGHNPYELTSYLTVTFL